MRNLTFRVFGEDPLDAGPPLFANFVGIASSGNEVQLEFVYLDINQLALRFGQPGVDDVPTAGVPEATGNVELHGKTVAKIVVPASSFLQLQGHLDTLFKRLKEASHGEKETGERGYGS